MKFTAVLTCGDKRYTIKFGANRVPHTDKEWMRAIKKSKKIPPEKLKNKGGIGFSGTDLRLEKCWEL